MVSMVDQMVDQNATYLTRRRGVHSDFRISRHRPAARRQFLRGVARRRRGIEADNGQMSDLQAG